MYTVSELIALKQRSGTFTEEQIQWIIDQILAEKAHDAQIGALLMVIFLKGMTREEILHLTKVMMHSGEVLLWPEEWKDSVVDKHSTGGVGDKISLVLAPALAACGVKIPMISGRSLGFTGGTLDKLESIPGFNILLSSDDMKRIMEDVGCCIVGQTKKLVPADKKLYSIRDITSTVASNPLIVSSIISKKAAESPKALVLDVKFGKGCFQKSENSAEMLANLLVNTGNDIGIKTSAVITDMDSPLGYAVGNALEVLEAIECLQGKTIKDVIELVVVQGGELLHLNGKVATSEEGQKQIEEVLRNGKALEKFKQMSISQGVTEQNADLLCKNPRDLLKLSENKTVLRVNSDGFVNSIDALACGEVSSLLGSGRQIPTDPVKYDTGLYLSVSLGDFVSKGDPWVTVYHTEPQMPEVLKARMEKAIQIVSDKVECKSKVYKVLRQDEQNGHIIFQCQ